MLHQVQSVGKDQKHSIYGSCESVSSLFYVSYHIFFLFPSHDDMHISFNYVVIQVLDCQG